MSAYQELPHRDWEASPGLPERLPAGERVLWQGTPSAGVFARRVFHVRKLAVYFALLLVWAVGSSLGGPLHGTGLALLRFGGLSAAALGVLGLLAWAIRATTVYTITDRRVVMRFGIALPLTINLPFAEISGADIRANPDGSGDVVLSLASKARIAYGVLWPHARPWRFSPAAPMLRAIPEVGRVAQILSRALAQQADLPAPAMPDLVAAPGRRAAEPALA